MIPTPHGTDSIQDSENLDATTEDQTVEVEIPEVYKIRCVDHGSTPFCQFLT
jgi:hypothetical protein